MYAHNVHRVHVRVLKSPGQNSDSTDCTASRKKSEKEKEKTKRMEIKSKREVERCCFLWIHSRKH
ncbi:hypothetical protein V1478_011910 [Vespula squamosa]|uniref:Uncharacterized protein n=1 Tax=Vespula squamosa TaxID=30214 RepID=A0ABD2ABP4_VESSQ